MLRLPKDWPRTGHCCVPFSVAALTGKNIWQIIENPHAGVMCNTIIGLARTHGLRLSVEHWVNLRLEKADLSGRGIVVVTEFWQPMMGLCHAMPFEDRKIGDWRSGVRPQSDSWYCKWPVLCVFREPREGVKVWAQKSPVRIGSMAVTRRAQLLRSPGRRVTKPGRSSARS